MKPKWRNILINNWTLALFISILIIWLVKPVEKKYEVELEKVESKLIDTEYYYADLDGDGNSEKIQFDSNQSGFGCIKIYNPAHLGQFNSNTEIDILYHSILAADTDGNNVKEIYFSGVRNDSAAPARLHRVGSKFLEVTVF